MLWVTISLSSVSYIPDTKQVNYVTSGLLAESPVFA